MKTIDLNVNARLRFNLLIVALFLTQANPTIGQSSNMTYGVLNANENWDDRFGPHGVDGIVKTMAVDGNDLYVGGILYFRWQISCKSHC